jgi:hypothetical protein
LVPVPNSGAFGADGPHVDLGALLIYTSDRDGFLRVCVFVVLFEVTRPASLPSTEDARLWREDHEESRKSAAPRDDVAFDDPFQANEDVSLRLPRLVDSVARDGCVIGSGDAPRDDNGEGVLRERVVPISAGARVVDNAEEKGWESLW